MDSTTAAVYHDTEGNTLFRYGHSKDHRPDLAQFKMMLGALEPLGMPLATLVVGGNEADDGLYVPAITQTRQVVGQSGRLYIGDAKMGALATHAFVAAGDDDYLMPLARTGEVPELMTELLGPVWKGEQPLQRVYASAGKEEGGEQVAAKRKLLAVAYETSRLQRAKVNGKSVVWRERLLLVYSPSLAKRARRGLARRLERAEQALLALTPPRGRGKRQWDDLETL